MALGLLLTRLIGTRFGEKSGSSGRLRESVAISLGLSRKIDPAIKHCMSASIVVDSSVIVKWLNQTDELHLAQADALLRRARNKSLGLSAPELAKFEVGNALSYKHLSLPELVEALSLLYSFPLTFISWNIALAARAAEFAATHSISYYDASFVALAEYLHAPLVTDNPKHQQKVKDVKVIPLVSYK